MTDQQILVLAATGKTGRRVVSRLRATGTPVRAASRSSDLRFDWTDESTWAPCLTGATGLYLVVPDEPAPFADFIGQAVAAGVRRIVLLSARGIVHYPPNTMYVAEQALRASDVDWTVLQPNWFNQNFDEYFLRDPLLAGELALPVGSTPEPFIDADDIADVAVAALTQDGHAGQTYELSGPRALSFAEATEIIATASGRRIRFTDVSGEQYVAAMTDQGAPPELATYLAGLFDVVRQGHITTVTDDVERVLGREPRTFESYVATAVPAWR
ncbi:SDR family oxidoreductase [Goodfellowiella coeruleoviolacea]|nr:SDR family oxidoreductase [Goodfellowiella coeruleoviolacea]